ncbi:MAG TPA: hypothetical protein VEY67_03025 [Candidatus Dormibacteraeota bacterium]|nr:hypothetical protein [Candidatus Dormibacteraeota bacterium]
MPENDDAPKRVAVERVRDVRLEIRLPTPPILELAFYAGALLTGIVLGAAVTIVTHAA